MKSEPSSSISVLKKSKKIKHHNLEAVQSEDITTDPEKPKKKEAKDPKQPHNTQKKGNKRKNRDAEEQDESMEHKARSEEAERELVPPKKRHKTRTADPREDAQLNTQSRKALEYVFTHVNRPSRWKFNKARQNWLIRNVWSPETVPDTYFPLVLKYLANVQGGSREKLKENCQTFLTAKAISVEAPPSAPLAETDVKPARPTPGPLIIPSSQPTPESIVPVAAINSAPILVSDAATILVSESIKRTRARSLLDALT